MKRWMMIPLMACLPMIAGCFSTSKSRGLPGGGSSGWFGSSSSSDCDPSGSLSILGWSGGICILAGFALVVISRGASGWRAVIGGVILVTLNFAILKYAHWIFIPAITATGMISIAWSYVQIKKIIDVKREQKTAAPTPQTSAKKAVSKKRKAK